MVLEIGVSHGGSMQVWKKYFGAESTIIGIDVNKQCRYFEEEGIDIHIGSQSDRTFLQEIKKKYPRIDIVIDDGGHYMDMQITSFEELYPHIQKDGIYLCEDVHTSYIDEYGGGLEREGTFIEYSKKLIDRLHAFHSRDKENFAPTKFTRSTNAIHFYDGIVVMEKKVRPKRSNWIRVGEKTLGQGGLLQRMKKGIGNIIKK